MVESQGSVLTFWPSCHPLLFFFSIRQSNERPQVASGIMAMPRSIMVQHASLSEALINDPSDFRSWYIDGHAMPEIPGLTGRKVLTKREGLGAVRQVSHY